MFLFSFSAIPQFFWGAIVTAIIALMGKHFFDPIYYNSIDYLRNNKGVIGNFYNWCNARIGAFVFFKKRKMHISLKPSGWEYQFKHRDGKLVCIASQITNLQQNIFDRLQANIKREKADRTYTTFTKGQILKTGNYNDSAYIILEESYTSGYGVSQATTHYILSDKPNTNMPGIRVEEEEGEVNAIFCILSFTELFYTSVELLLEGGEHYQTYLEKFNIDIKTLTKDEKEIQKK